MDYFDLDTETWSAQETSPAISLTRYLQVRLEVDALFRLSKLVSRDHGSKS